VRVGQGFDAHRLVAGVPLVLAGVTVPHATGLDGHSDGDVVLHAVADALLGALGDGDLGRHFPSSDEALRGIDSRVLLGRVVERMEERGYRVGNVDVTVIAQAPRLSPYQKAMHEALASTLRCQPERVNLKLTSTDRLGAVGREEGIATLAVALLESTAS
jgi:2-C-methyl-D-erythritol 2,4-cyclodiphosphate synthase